MPEAAREVMLRDFLSKLGYYQLTTLETNTLLGYRGALG